jgi:hypothetical protein
MQLALSTLANTHAACTLQRMGIHYLITTSAAGRRGDTDHDVRSRPSDDLVRSHHRTPSLSTNSTVRVMSIMYVRCDSLSDT